MRRGTAAAFIGALLLGALFVGGVTPAGAAGAAGASPANRRMSTSCALTGELTYKPALNAGQNADGFIRLVFRLSDCRGAEVTTGRGRGGSVGALTCEAGQVTGSAIAKLAITWDNGK